MGPLLFIIRLLFLLGLYALAALIARSIWLGLPRTSQEALPLRQANLRLCQAAGQVLVNGMPLAVGAKIQLPMPATMGRQAGNTIQIDDPFVSSCHAELVSDGPAYLVIDRGSKNGTWLGRQRLAKPGRWDSGIELKLGGTVFRLEE